MTDETREFPTAVIASLSSGILMCDFGAMHEAAEYLMGHPIWTHHFGSRDLWKSMQAKIIEQCPDMPLKMEGVTKENCEEKVLELETRYGKTVTIRQGTGETAMDPLEGIPAGKPTILVGVK